MTKLKGRDYLVVAATCDGLSAKEIGERENMTAFAVRHRLQKLQRLHKAKNTTHLIVILATNKTITL